MSRAAEIPSEGATVEARSRIMRAAEKLFAEKGYAATAVHEITDAARVNRALLYYYFADKHSLYAALIDEGHAEFQKMLDAALSGPGSYGERLAAVIRGHLGLIWDRGDVGRMVHRCLLDGYQDEFGLTEKWRRSIGRMEAFFQEAMDTGEFRPANPAIVARTFLGSGFSFTLCSSQERECFAREEIAEQIIRQLLDGLRAA